MLEDIDLLAGLQEVRDHVIDNNEQIDLPTDDETPGGLLTGPDVPLEVDQGIDQEEIADLLQDVADHDNPQQVVEDDQNESIGNDHDFQDGNEEDDSVNCDEISLEEPEIDDVPPLMSEGEHQDDEDGSGDEQEDDVAPSNERPTRNVGAPERYNPETGRSYAQVEVCHNIVTDNHPEDRTLKYEEHETVIVAQVLCISA